MSPKGERSKKGRWLIPISMKRVALNEKGNETGVHQVVEMIKELGIEDELCINTGDSLYGSEGVVKKRYYKKTLFRCSAYQTKESFIRPQNTIKFNAQEEENCLVTR